MLYPFVSIDHEEAFGHHIVFRIHPVALPCMAAEAHGGEEEGKVDAKEIIFEHLGDRYGWEVPFCHDKSIPLPIILWGHDGLHCFMSSKVGAWTHICRRRRHFPGGWSRQRAQGEDRGDYRWQGI